MVHVGCERVVARLADGVVVQHAAPEDPPPPRVVDPAALLPALVAVRCAPAGVVGAAATLGGYLGAAWLGAEADGHRWCLEVVLIGSDLAPPAGDTGLAMSQESS